MDNLKLCCIFQSNDKGDKHMYEGGDMIIIEGLFIHGATLQEACNGLYKLIPVTANLPATAPTPPLRLMFLTLEEKEEATDLMPPAGSSFIDIPMYSSSTREQKLLDAKIMCSKDEASKWILSGVALYVEEL